MLGRKLTIIGLIIVVVCLILMGVDVENPYWIPPLRVTGLFVGACLLLMGLGWDRSEKPASYDND